MVGGAVIGYSSILCMVEEFVLGGVEGKGSSGV